MDTRGLGESNLGTMEQFHAGMRKTYTIHSESERWYKAGTQDNAPNLIPIRGGNLDYDKPTQGIKYFRNTIFHFYAQADVFIDLEIRLPPDGTTSSNQHAPLQYLHVLDTGNYNSYQVQHAI